MAQPAGCVVTQFRGGGGADPGRRTAWAEQAEELRDLRVTSRESGFGEGGEPAGRAEQRRRPPWQRQDAGEPAAGGQIHQVRYILAAQDLHGGQVTPRRNDLPRDHLPWVGEVVAVAFAAAQQRQHERVAAAPPRAARALHVVGGPCRQRRQHHRRQVADVDTQFQGGGARQHVRVGVPAAVPELLFDLLPLGTGQHAGVLTGDDPKDSALGVQPPVVVGGNVIIRSAGESAGGSARGEPAGAAVPPAALPDPVGHPRRGHGLRPRARVAADSGGSHLAGIKPGHPDVAGLQPVDDGGGVVGDPPRQQPGVGEDG